MKREDWTGLAISLGIHLGLVVLLSLFAAASPEEQPMGFMEVEFGPLSEGRPVQQAPVREDPKPEEVPEIEEELERPAVAPPEDVRPVDLPDAELDVPEQEVVDAPEADVIAPEESQTKEEEVAEEVQPEREVVQPLGSGSLLADEGTDSGEEGELSEETARSPFQIEGLNRAPVSTPIPVYSSQVNALIRVRITVDPLGRIIRRIPLIKGDPTLERAVMDALLRWRFNRLPAEAPQENQTGVVSFRFRLR